MNLHELEGRKAQLISELKNLVTGAEKEDRSFNEAEKADFERMEAQLNTFEERIGRAKKVAEREGFEPSQAPQPKEDPGKLGLSKKEARSYSIYRAVNAVVDGDWSNAGFEREVSQAVTKRMGGRTPQSFYVPADVMAVERRADQTITASDAAALIYTTDGGMSYIDALRAQNVLRKAGATILSGLVGPMSVGSIGAGSYAWVSDGSAPDVAGMTFSAKTMSSKTVAAYDLLTRKALKQASPSLDHLAMMDLTKGLSGGIEAAILAGSDVTNAPPSIAGTTGVGSVAGGTNGLAPTWAHVVGLESQVANDNAQGTAYVTNSKVRGKLKQTLKSSGIAGYIWDEDNRLNGYDAHVSNHVPSDLTKGSTNGSCSAIFFGDWSELIIGMWGGLDILVDPYTHSTDGGVLVTAFQDTGAVIRHAESFAVMLDAITV